MNSQCDYLLRFQPLFRRYLWGGRRLGTMLGKAIGPGDDYAESWEIVDHGDDQSVVTNGPLAGKTLGELVREQPAALLGELPDLHYVAVLSGGKRIKGRLAKIVWGAKP